MPFPTRRAVLLAALSSLLLAPATLHAQAWSETARLLDSRGGNEDAFGRAVDVDGDRILVGAERGDGTQSDTGVALLYERDPATGAWTPAARLESPDVEPFTDFGASVALDGDVAVVGVPFADGVGFEDGAAYIFERDPDTDAWAVAARVTDTVGEQFSRFGASVDVDGDRVVVGAPESGAGFTYQSGTASVFERQPDGTWLRAARLEALDATDFDAMGASVSIRGNLVLAGAPQAFTTEFYGGAAYLFRRTADGRWNEFRKLVPPTPGNGGGRYGESVAIAADVLVIGAPGDDDLGSSAGAAYVYTPDRFGTWLQRDKLVASDGGANDIFGTSIDVDPSGRIIVGAPWEGTFGTNEGAAYVFESDGADDWSETARLVASDRDTGDWFGDAVALEGPVIAVGIPNDDDLGDGSGSVRVFEIDVARPVLTVGGSCPGETIVEIANATPNGRVALFAGFTRGDFVIPAEPCPGTVIGIPAPFLGGGPVVPGVDGNGATTLRGTTPPGVCGELLLQAVDLSTCGVGPVVVVE